MAPNAAKIRVCVIGAGPAGLCAARHLLGWDFEAGLEVMVFEKSNKVGGLWQYDEKEDSHSSIYQSLKTNLPKEIMAFQDFPFPKSNHSFLTHTEVKDYLESYCRHFELEKVIHFGVAVNSVKPQLDGDKIIWKVDTSNGVSYDFDAVLLCNGHFTVPYIPVVADMEKFAGVQLHSHNYRKPDKFAGQNVLVLGPGASGCDIAVELSSVASKVYLGHNGPRILKIPANLEQVYSVERCIADGVFQLTDGSLLTGIDSVVFCTGYKYDFPFLDPGCLVDYSDFVVGPLYKHIVNINYPSMGFIGIISKNCPFPQFDVQVQFFLKHISGQIEMPSKEDMIRDLERSIGAHLETGKQYKHFHRVMDVQWQYCRDLARLANLKELPLSYEAMFDEVYERRCNFLLGYRNDVYEFTSNGGYTRK